MKTEILYRNNISQIIVPIKTIRYFGARGFLYRHHVLTHPESNYTVWLHKGIITFSYPQLTESDKKEINHYANNVFSEIKHYVLKDSSDSIM